jgi:2,3-bisphosphoglycerate-dependent phosphoglycerate mutase
MAQLILMRHGQSIWNLHNLFTGWVDVPLSQKGIEEAFAAGQQIKHTPIDIIFMSALVRAQTTAMLAMSLHTSGHMPVVMHPVDSQLQQWGAIHSSETTRNTIPAYIAWELNERMYGELQGLNKQETIDKFGLAQVQKWRRSYDIAPPGGESLAMTAARALPYFLKSIVPCLERGQNVFISAHGNSLRAIMMHIENYSPEEIISLELATGEPLFYRFENGLFVKEHPPTPQMKG